ncbi:hypothetical protein B7C51_03475 [Paenibacillus larvae subsp. pulvifaciens]|uniref:HTH cro/C1-type domain-containing protein n=1 Tax=Paenibacillus larvae subsp. pulvifaciens TaxID=1477 RepID=A0A1V0UP70_9BACL|nr:hypothetical protein [Paenibacillus larvae]ARF67075.1 hypothetical protein B7C51_03475 [Paenibacillus larvae subsp. pulvifaciens]
MKYSQLIDAGIKLKNYNHSEVVLKLKERGVNVDRTFLSKLRNGKYTSTKDELNVALADVLGIDRDLLRVAAIKEKLPSDILELLKKIG